SCYRDWSFRRVLFRSSTSPYPGLSAAGEAATDTRDTERRRCEPSASACPWSQAAVECQGRPRGSLPAYGPTDPFQDRFDCDPDRSEERRVGKADGSRG